MPLPQNVKPVDIGAARMPMHPVFVQFMALRGKSIIMTLLSLVLSAVIGIILIVNVGQLSLGWSELGLLSRIVVSSFLAVNMLIIVRLVLNIRPDRENLRMFMALAPRRTTANQPRDFENEAVNQLL